jgi:hypothetical protein
MDAARMGEPPVASIDASAERSADLEPRCRGDLRAEPVSTGLSVFGWVVSEEEGTTVAEVEIAAGGDLLTRVPVEVERPDVIEALELEAGERPGFYAILAPSGEGSGRLTVNAVTGEGAKIPLGTVTVTVGSDSSQQPGLAWSVLLPPPEREKVLVGKNGWLYLVRDSNDVIGQQTGRVRLSERAKRDWEALLTRRMAAIEGVGAVWRTMVVPDKEIVYPEHLPDEIVPALARPVHEILTIADRVGAPVAYALEDLQRAKKSQIVFPRTDSHWSHRGALVAYRSLCDLVAAAGVPAPVLGEEEIDWSELMVPGGLGRKMDPPRTSPTPWATLRSHRSRLVFDNQVVNHGRVTVFEQEGRGGPSCVLFGESFAQHLVLFLKESFGRLVYVHTSMLVDEILAAERPDVVVGLPVERFLIKVPDDRPGLASLAATAAEKAERGVLGSEMAFVAAVPRADGAGGPDQKGKMPWRW